MNKYVVLKECELEIGFTWYCGYPGCYSGEDKRFETFYEGDEITINNKNYIQDFRYSDKYTNLLSDDELNDDDAIISQKELIRALNHGYIALIM